jgi:hypothetical protein
MNIYIAGIVLRESLDKSLLEFLDRLYVEIKQAAAEVPSEPPIVVQIPYPDPQLEEMRPGDFVVEVRDRIMNSDAVISIFSPPSVAVAFEAQLAAELQKPQAILAARRWHPPRFLLALPHVVGVYAPGEDDLRQVFTDLIARVNQGVRHRHGGHRRRERHGGESEGHLSI